MEISALTISTRGRWARRARRDPMLLSSAIDDGADGSERSSEVKDKSAPQADICRPLSAADVNE
jgi:hypothetical protein